MIIYDQKFEVDNIGQCFWKKSLMVPIKMAPTVKTVLLWKIITI